VSEEEEEEVKYPKQLQNFGILLQNIGKIEIAGLESFRQ
jgi:hypothetical protein